MLKELARHYKLFITSEIPEAYFRSFLPDMHFRSASPDTGCAQTDFIQVDRRKSFLSLAQFLENEETHLENEKRWLAEQEIDLLISDVPSLPLKAAGNLGIPAMAVSNFNWHDIYSGFPESSRYPELLDSLRDHYASCTMQVLPQLHIANKVVPRLETVGLLSLPGQNIREQLQESLPPHAYDRPWVFIYLGRYDCSAIHWEGLAKMDDYFFLTRDEIPVEVNCSNLACLDEQFTFPDLMASSDLILTKAGYSTLATAFCHNKPVVTCERPDFKEFEAIQACLLDNRVGELLPSGPFYRLEWQDSIKKALKLTVKGKIEGNGQRDVKRLVDELLSTPTE